MNSKMVYGLALIVLGAVLSASGDVIVLQNGDRVEGEIVSETPTEVLIKRAYKGGNIKFTDKIERSKIARIEKGESESPASIPASEAAQSQPSSTQPVALTDADRKKLLSDALADWEKQNYTAAGMALSRLINGSTKVELNLLSKEVESRIELSLGDMAAEAHLQAAIIRSRGQSVSLLYVTEYETPYLVPRLINAYQESLKTPIAIKPVAARPAPSRQRPKPGTHARLDEAPPPEPPAESQPAGKTFVLSELLNSPESFDGIREETMAIAKQIRRATSLLTARMRFDSEYKNNPQVRDEIKNERDRLTALQKALFGKTGEETTQKKTSTRGPQMRPGERGNEGEGPRGEGQGPGGRGKRIIDHIQQQERQGGEGGNVDLNEEQP